MKQNFARDFCEIALKQGFIAEEQVNAFRAQAATGFRDPATYFLHHGILNRQQIGNIQRQASSVIAGATQILQMHDSLLDLPRPAGAKTTLPPIALPKKPPAPPPEKKSVPVEDDSLLELEPPSGARPRPAEVPSPESAEEFVIIEEPVQAPPPAAAPAAPITPTSPTVPARPGAVEEQAAQRLVMGRYMIIEELGRGGMGIVYKAHDIQLNRVIALKVMKGDDFAAGDVNRFLKEGRLAGSLAHPNIVTVFDTQADKKNYYIVMEYVQGSTLDKYIEKESGETTPAEQQRLAELAGQPGITPPTVQTDEPTMGTAKIISTIYRGEMQDAKTVEIIGIIRQAADALQFAHERSIIHRDIKPQNILVDKRGVPKVMDFGLAKDVGAQSLATASGTIMGTPQYMSPEQAQGDVRNLDARSDVYSLTAVLYYCFCGMPPFQGPTIYDTLQKVVNEDPVTPTRIKPSMDRDLEIILMKGMAKEKERRYQSMRELSEDLERYLKGESIVAQADGLAYQAKKKIRKSWKLKVAIAAVVVASLSGSYYWARTAQMRHERELRAQQDQQRDQARQFFEAARGLKGQGALDQLNKAVTAAPAWSDARLERCRVLFAMGDTAGALKDAEAAVAESPALANYWMGCMIEAMGGEGSDKRAKACYAECAKGAKGQWYVQLALANIDRLEDRYADAIEKASGVIGKDGTIEEAYTVRGRAYTAQKNHPEAGKDFSSVLKLNPYNANAYVNRGSGHALQGEYPKAIFDYTAALDINPKFTLALYCRGSVQKEQKNMKACVTDWQALLKVDPNYPNADLIRKEIEQAGVSEETASADELLEQARGLLKRREYARAKEKVYKALEANPDGPVLHWHAWRICLREAKDLWDLTERRRLLRDAFEHEMRWRKAKDFNPMEDKNLPQAFPLDDRVWEKIPLG